MNFKDFYNYKLVQEVHYSDMFPKGFQEFYNKWKKHKKDSTLYVRFDGGNTSDVLSKDFNKKPNHSDPLGTYAYPLKYVIDHPADIWYGHNSTQLKVIRDKSSKGYIRLDSMDDIDARNLLRKVGLDGGYHLAQKFYPNKAKGVTAPGKLFMAALQMDFTGATPPNKRKNEPNPIYPKVRSGKTQTELLLKMGVSTLEDKSNRITQASINDREPEQILWLKPSDFEILEVFRLSDRQKNTPSVIFNSDRLSKKIAAGLSEIMNDKIIDYTTHHNEFWTKNARKIVISKYDSSVRWRIDNMKIGQKPHKMFKKDSPIGFDIKILTERGDFSLSFYTDENLEKFLSKFNEKWKSTPQSDNGNRYSKKQQEEQEKKEKDERTAKANEVARKEYAENFDRYITPSYNQLADYFNFEKIPENMTLDQKAETYKFMQGRIFDLSSEIWQFYTEVNKEIIKNYEKIINYISPDTTLYRFPAHNLNAALEKIKKNPVN